MHTGLGRRVYLQWLVMVGKGLERESVIVLINRSKNIKNIIIMFNNDDNKTILTFVRDWTVYNDYIILYRLIQHFKK